MTAFAIIIVLLAFILFFLIEPRRCSQKQEEDFCRLNYAHRGLHTKDKTIPENSKAAFRLAAAAGYGIELDIRLSKDGRVVVFHDDTLERVCGVSGRVDAFDFQELQQFSLCGTEEKIPLFTDVLALVGGRVPLLVELKSGRQNRELCRKTAEILGTYDGLCCIESFDPRIVGWFSRHRANIFRGQLTDSFAGLKSGTVPAAAFLVSMMLGNFLARPHFIAHGKGKKSIPVLICEWLGAKRFVWTVRDTDDAREYEKENDAVIFEYYRPKTWIG